MPDAAAQGADLRQTGRRSSRAGRNGRNSVSPASVVETERVVRQQPDLQPLFQPLHRVAQGGLRHAEPRSRPREALLFGDDCEGCQIVQRR